MQAEDEQEQYEMTGFPDTSYQPKDEAEVDDDDTANAVDPFEDTPPTLDDKAASSDSDNVPTDDVRASTAIVEEEHAISVSAALAQFDHPGDRPLIPDDKETVGLGPVPTTDTAPATSAEEAAEEEDGVFDEAWDASERRGDEDNQVEEVATPADTEPPLKEEDDADDKAVENENESEEEEAEPAELAAVHEEDEDEEEDEPASTPATDEEDDEEAEEAEEEDEAATSEEAEEEPATATEDDPQPEETAAEAEEEEPQLDEKDEEEEEEEDNEEEEEDNQDEQDDVIAPLATAGRFDSAMFVEGGDTTDSDQRELKVSVVMGSHGAPQLRIPEPPPEQPAKSLRVMFYDLGSSDADLVLETLTQLGSMDLHDTHKENKPKDKVLVSKGAAPMAVMQALRNHGQENADIASKGLSLLLSLSATGEKGCEKTIVELDGTATILQTMKYHPDKVNIQVHGLGLLCNLSALGRKEVAKIAECGGIDVVINDMKTWPKLKYVQRRGCKTLANMASEKKRLPQIKKEIRDKKGLSTMGRCLETFAVDSSAFIEARRAMQYFL